MEKKININVEAAMDLVTAYPLALCHIYFTNPWEKRKEHILQYQLHFFTFPLILFSCSHSTFVFCILNIFHTDLDLELNFRSIAGQIHFTDLLTTALEKIFETRSYFKIYPWYLLTQDCISNFLPVQEI
ncbi:hypothetical protein ACJIZ3_017319 [Penstemon smallii]|uniref:Uncharacterized protein n=1 Tax=Penstemon smallii TaxID=265156 RepID=A0ABD3SWH8_9LAMI